MEGKRVSGEDHFVHTINLKGLEDPQGEQHFRDEKSLA